jgi:hypothetical protein
MSMSLFLLFVVGALAYDDLTDGQSYNGHIINSTGGSHSFRFRVDEKVSLKDLSVVLTTFSDWTDPDLYMSPGTEPTSVSYTWKSAAWGSDAIVLGDREVTENTDYFMLVTCATYCRFRITVSYAEELTLVDGQPQQGTLLRSHSEVYKYVVIGEAREAIKIRTLPSSGYLKMYVTEGVDSTPTVENSLPITSTYQHGSQCEINDAVPGTTYKIIVLASTDTDYVISSVRSEGVSELQASRPTEGEVDTNQFVFYKFYVDDPAEQVTIKITAYGGDPDLYVRYNSKPTLTDFDFRSEQSGEETLVLTEQNRSNLGGETGWYFVGVFGRYHSVYTITVSVNTESAVPLFNGNPQQGFVEKDQVDLYYADVSPRTDLNMTVRLSPSAGDPDLFVKLCPESWTDCVFSVDELSSCHRYPDIKKSRHSSGDDVVVFSHRADQCPSTGKLCRYLIAVVGLSVSRSVFSIVLTTSNEIETILRDGRPEHLSLGAGEEKYYKFVVYNTTVEDVTFMLTPEQGDADLYVSRLVAKPTHSTSEKSSENLNSVIESVKYEKGVDGASLNSTYHVTVRASTAATFSLVAKETVPSWNSTIVLVPGRAQLDTVYNYPNGEHRIYSFSLHYTAATAQAVHITLTPYTGKYTLYVANRPENLNWSTEVFYYNWCTCNNSHPDQSTVLNLSPSDSWYRPSSTYLVLVMANEFAADLSATYSITYSTGDGTVRLQEGVQFMDDVSEGNYKFYNFPVHDFHEDVNIKITSYSGDPDLYLSVHSNNTKPSRESYDFASNGFGSEVMTLTWEQGLRDVCPKRPDYDRDPQLCMLYLSVFGYRNSSYSIAVTTRKDIPAILVEGFPVTGQINETQYDYYYTYFGVSAPVSVVMEALNGDPDLFINVIDSSTTANLTEWTRPNKRAFDYSSQSSQTSDIILISEEDLRSRCPSTSCVVLTGVYCFSTYCRYSINTHQDTVPGLLDGQPRIGNVVEHLYNYYSFLVNSDDATILISLTSTSQGDPDLVVSKGASARPTRENCTWTSYNFGSEHLLITADDDRLSGSTRGVYVIGVYGFSNTTYTLTATAAAVPVILLLPGQPHSAAMEANSTNYFYFMIENESTVSITLTLTSGSPVLAASKSEADPYDHLPTLMDNTWSSLQSRSRNELEIKPTDPAFCLYCLVVVGVFTQDASSAYSITFSYSSTQLILQNGVPHKDFISAGAWQYYSFSVPDFSGLAVSITAFSGNPDLYVGFASPVTPENAIWHSEHKSRVDYIRIRTEDEDFTLGVYTIGVFGVKDSSYSITAHSRNSYITLVDGWPQTYSVNYLDHDHLAFMYTPSYSINRNTYCRLMPLSPDFFPRLYYTFQPWGETKQIPSHKNHDVALDADEYDSIFAEMKFTLPYKSSGTYLIGVYGAEAEGHKFHEIADFELYCSSEDQFNLLRVGYNEFEVLTEANSTKRYEMHINEPGTLEIFVEPCVGKVSLGISSNFTRVNETDLVVTRITDGKLVATVPHARGQYYITVKEVVPSSFFEGASYLLTSRLTPIGKTRPQDLIPGGSGLLQWEAIGRGEVRLKWSPVTYENGEAIDQQKDPVVYRVYYTDHDEIKMVTACEMHAGELLDIVENALDGGFTKDTSISGEIEVDRKFLVNVVAYLRRGEGGMLEHIVYTPTEVYLPSAHPEGVDLFVFVMIAGVVGVSLGAAFIFYRKYRQVQSRLEYEMTDVRNIAGYSSESLGEESLSSFGQTPKYSPLVAVRQ